MSTADYRVVRGRAAGWRRGAVAVAVLAAVTTGGWVAGRADAAPVAAGRGAAVAPSRTGAAVGPVEGSSRAARPGFRAGVPVGYAQTLDAAGDAAVDYLAALTTPKTRTEQQRLAEAVATPAARPLLAGMGAPGTDPRTNTSGFHPVRAVTAVGAGGFLEVRVYGVALFSGTTDGRTAPPTAPSAVGALYTVGLCWVADRWRLTRLAVVTAPAPEPVPVAAGEPVPTLDLLTDVYGPSSWTPRAPR